MNASSRAFTISVALPAISVMLAQPARAQVSAPPTHDTLSATGVSYANGSFNWQEQDLSIGGEDGLSLNRIYLSTSADGNFAPGWTHNLFSLIRNQPVPTPPDIMPPPPQFQAWSFNIIVGNATYIFVGGDAYPNQGKPVGTYQSAADNGASLIYTGTNATGFYTLTTADGSVINFNGGLNSRISNWTKPDGTRLDYSYGTNMMVMSNRGYAIIVEGKTKACAVNLAHTYVAPGGACPTGVPTVTYGYTTGTFNTSTQLLTSATKAGKTTTYGYVGADHLGCVKAPSQSTCRISNQYGTCPENPSDPSTHYSWRYFDPVLLQTTGTGETYSYGYGTPASNVATCNSLDANSNPTNEWRFAPGVVAMTTNTAAVTKVQTSTAGTLMFLSDPLGHQTTADYTGNGVYDLEQSQLVKDTTPEGIEGDYAYDSRGNFTSKTTKAKTGSGLSNIVTSAAYPATCTDPKTCNKPSSTTDGRGGVANYTYDTNSGEVLSEMQPAPTTGAARPLKLYTYVQKYAYVLNSGGTLVPAAYPVWVPNTVTQCQTVAGSSTATCDAAASQMVTTYEYGANGTADNLLVHGLAVTADGQTLRTCYGYDTQGNKISETKPRAALAVCP